jgi:hypothetical protein
VLSLETLFEHSLAAIDNQAKDIDKAQKAGLLELVSDYSGWHRMIENIC